MIHHTLQTIVAHLRKEGLVPTVRKIVSLVWYDFLHRPLLVFRFANNRKLHFPDVTFNGHYTISRFNRRNHMPPQLFDQYAQKFGKYRGAKAIADRYYKRLAYGAELWMVCRDGDISSTWWSIRGRFIVPFLFPIGKDEVIVFDSFTFEKYRRRGLSQNLLKYIVQIHGNEGVLAFYLCTKTWNAPSIKIAIKTNFKEIGKASQFIFFDKQIIFWHY